MMREQLDKRMRKFQKEMKKIDIHMKETGQKTRLVLSGIVTVFMATIIIFLFDIFTDINLRWAVQPLLVLNWFILFSWTLYLVRSDKGIVSASQGFNLILVSIVVIASCAKLFFPYVAIEVILWTSMVLFLVHIFYSGIAYRPWWLIKGKKY